MSRTLLLFLLWSALALGAEDKPEPIHWAYRKPVRPALPAVKDMRWPRNGIDVFVLHRLEKEGLVPSAEADRPTLIRRASLDLIGLPPTIAEVDEFVNDKSPDAYEKVIERLLASPRYGERWARPWLDAARYADTNGYEKDRPRSIWLWRDWVVRALNADMPFDQFTIEQLAGDLLPGATLDQKIATGFHRNTMLNDEGGIDAEEFRVVAVKDRVDATATIWLGTTLDCAQCHNHKYDPFSQREYYQFYAFFNQTADSGVGNGPEIAVPSKTEQNRTDELTAAVAVLEKSRQSVGQRLEQAQAEWEKTVRPRDTVTGPPHPALSIVQTPAEKRTPEQAADLAAYYRMIDPELNQIREEIDRHRAALAAIRPATTMIMAELPKPRENYVMLRGNFNQKGKPVEPATPTAFHPFPNNAPRNRLGLARWLVDRENPLSARVTVNRHWQAIFGQGLVQTPEDFGSQGETPTYPELLDWLAVEFMEKGWSFKELHRLIVTSATYRQTSRTTAELLQRDPYNMLYARGPRMRVEYEMLRDLALASGGLLSQKIGGPSVMPPQPPGVWENSFGFYDLPDFRWKEAVGDDRYRRGIYIFLRRTAMYPTFVMFDAPGRDMCSVKRPRTNTPLQALTTLNDPVFVEAAAGLAHRIITEAPESLDERIRFAFRLCLARHPAPDEIERLAAVYQRACARYERDPQEAERLLKQVQQQSDQPAPQMAAWIVVANVLLNLDETLTKG
jgi:hypothetical protein